ncbi:MAG TPA: DUF3558 family protein [Lentzea sp.]
MLTAGCTGTTGEAKPDPTSGGTTPTSSSNKLASMKPCDLLTETDATGLSFKYPGKDADIGTADGCEWVLKDGSGTGVSASIRTKGGVKDLDLKGSKILDVKVGGFAGKKVEAPDNDQGTCSVVIAVTETSSVSIISAMGGTNPTDTAAACELGTKTADLIAQKLS